MPGNGPPHAAHLTTPAARGVRRVRVDLGVLQWYQKQAGLVGFFLILGRRPNFYAEGFTSAG